MFIPLNKKIIVRRDKAKEVTEGGIFIPDPDKDKPSTGTILAVAPDCELFEQKASGGKVWFGRYAGMEMEMENENGDPENLLVIPEKEIIGVKFE